MTSNTIKFERRIQHIFLVILFGAILLGVLAFYSFNKISQTMNKIIFDHSQDVIALQSLQIIIEKKISQGRAYLFTSDEPFLWDTMQEHQNFKTQLTKLRSEILTSSGMEYLNKIEAAEFAHQKAIEDAMLFKAKNVSIKKVIEFWEEKVQPKRQLLDDVFSDAISQEGQRLEREIARSKKEETNVFYLIIASLFAAAVFGLGLFWLISRTVNELGYLFKERELTETNLRRALKETSDLKKSLDKASIFATTDANGVITYVNDIFCKISQYSRGELIGRTHRLVNSGYHPKAFFENLWSTIKRGDIWRGEIKNQAKDGTYYWVDTFIIPFLDNEGNPYQYTAIRTDITFKKNAEEKIKIAQDQLQSIIDAASSIIYLRNHQQELVFINKLFEKVFDVQKEDVIGKKISDIFPPGMANILTSDETQQKDVTLNYNNKVKTFMQVSFPLKNSRGNIYAIGGMLTDVTERKEIELNLKAALEARDEFLSVASHELKTPLSSLRLQSQMTLRNLALEKDYLFDPKKIAQLTEQTEKHVTRLVRLVDDMLDMARIRSGRLSIHREHVNLADILREILQRLDQELKEAKILLIVSKVEDAWGNWDRFRIEQVLSNLLTNAIKYGELRPIQVSLWRQAGRANLAITDQGVGIAKESQARIFDRFERAISSSEVSGLGLGLFIAQELITAHEGSITVESELGKGATFTIQLPLATETTT
jgi:PAS domain S-box-containing protein